MSSTTAASQAKAVKAGRPIVHISQSLRGQTAFNRVQSLQDLANSNSGKRTASQALRDTHTHTQYTQGHKPRMLESSNLLTIDRGT